MLRASDPVAGADRDWAKAKEFWSFQPPVASALPRVGDPAWPRQRVDHFVLASMEAQGLRPAPEAERALWLRRVSFILTGLAPAEQDVEVFARDTGPAAHERAVDRLLASAGFGERMASLWLNLARYGEDQAHQVGDDTKQFYPNAHLYRAWVIEAFNQDLPYDQFIRLQLAADLVCSNDTDVLPALGFVGLGPKYYNRGRLEVMADEWEDRVDTVCRTFLGLTVACARCHDHKYDPVTMEDYYALAGVFASTRMYNKPFQEPSPAAAVAPAESAAGSEKEKKEKNAKPKKKDEPDPRQTMHVVQEGEVQNLPVFLRGNVENKGPESPRRFLRVLCAGDPRPFTRGSGRLELADAIADPANPLTARVMVNRLWDLVFGRPLVGTPSNFGSLGERPTHPELLDDLAARFAREGWRVKPLIREMVLSATFRQSSRGRPECVERDPANRYWSRMSRRRLTVEMWRDAVLQASGALSGEGGESLELDDPSNRRRTVYARVSRLKLNDFLMQFDYPDANVHSDRRAETTTPMQKLFVLNSPFIWRQAGVLAERLGSSGDDRQRMERVYGWLFSRPPTVEEIRLGGRFLEQAGGSAGTAWTSYTQALLASNEMLYLD